MSPPSMIRLMVMKVMDSRSSWVTWLTFVCTKTHRVEVAQEKFLFLHSKGSVNMDEVDS